MNKEDIEFLKDLQREINMQDSDGNAQPVFWVVNENKREWGFNSGYADNVAMCSCDGETWNTPEEFLEFLIDNEYVFKGQIDENYDYDFDELLEMINDCDFYTCGYRDEDRTVEDTFFLTKRACKQHIEQNGYHYTKPHTYAMTAWRSPEYERFITLFKNINLDEIEVDNETL